jgi:murein DD-endopeptidase MepM/ murein hydrolase activator NlpD
MKILEVVFSPTSNGQGGLDIITDESALIASENPIFDDSASYLVPDVAVDHEGDAAIKTYIVKSGDTISSIADSFGVSQNTIVWANNLDRKATLKIGETLTILPVSGIQYTVRKGDTINGIAKRYGAEPADIMDFNDKKDGDLVAGEKLLVPGAELVPVTDPGITKVATATKPKTATPLVLKAPDLSEAVDVASVTEPVFGTLIRPKTNTGDSSSFIRPIAEGLGRKSQDKHDTWAVDLAVVTGTPIMAAQSGTVILVKSGGYNGGYGSYVVIEHAGGIQTLYAHMSKTIAKVGDVVAQGETIGLVGSTGRSTGPHVHYEVRGAPNNCFKACE